MPPAPPAPENAPTLAEQVAALSAVVAGLTREVAALRQRTETISTFERLRDVVLSRHATQPYRSPSSSRIEARDFMELTEGLYFLEYAPSGVAYRWTGPGHFTRFRFNVDRSVPVRVQLHLFSLGKISSADMLTADIDGVVYPFRPTDNIDELETDPVPPRPGERQTDVLLHVPVLFTPEGGSGDSRRLGIAVTGIVLEPAT